MAINTNRLNRWRYTLYSPVYDLVARLFNPARQRSITKLQLQKGDRVLLVGAGTGLDLPYFPADCHITATDLTPAMLQQLAQNNRVWQRQVHTQVMDGQQLAFADEQFDAVVLHLILAVIPDPVACLREAERVLKKGGQLVVFDKFIPAKQTISLARRLLNPLTNLLFSDITRDFYHIHQHSRLKVLSDEAGALKGAFRIILLEK